ncbi:MAG: translation initiation factor IF-2, partial [Bacteroidales bacterium]|nr:translation initiation factor IF-2 [Bacteroidales bacterium]
MESTQVDFRQNAKKLENERIAAKNARLEAEAAAKAAEEAKKAAAEAAARREAEAKQAQSSKQAPREERYQRNERTQGNAGQNQGERPQRNNSGRGEGFNRSGNQNGRGDFRNNGSDRNNNKPGNNSGRGERTNGGQDNRFKRPEKPGKSFIPEAPVKDEKRRDEEKRRNNQERDKKSKKDFMFEEDEAMMKNKNKAGRFIKPEKKVEEVVEEQIKVITIPDSLTIKDLADKMKMQPSVIIKKLFLQGQIVTVNSEISFEDAENIAIDYEIICEKEVKVDVIEELLKEEEEQEENLKSRPPVICVMGHVDHGKTSLLDAIRKTNVTDKEAGGITQHIGAYTVNINGQSITFLDTPGHEAFTAMRMRGANSTDIAILVVAADDGVMPQTVEAINHAKAAGIEIIVAVNKIDKPSANIDRVKQEMTEYELIPVDWGGTTEFVPVSAKSGEGIETLLETILLTAEIMELKANPNRSARGLVIEAELDKGRGPVATVLVQKGTLHVGDFISAGASHGKVRAMVDDKGRRVKEADPSTPVEILGLSDVPSAGEVFIAHETDKLAKSYAETYQAQNKEKMLEETKAKMSLDDLFTQIQAGNLKELNIIVKADVQGSVEAVKQSLMKLSNEEVVVKCIHGGVGAINESDVSLASASSAIIIGFNVRPDVTAKAVAEREGVDIRLYRVIYQAIEDIEAAMKGMLDPVFEEKVIGHAEV